MKKQFSFKRYLRRFLVAALVIFLLINMVAFLHAWNFTHFSRDVRRTPPPEELTLWGKMNVLLTGVSLNRPENYTVPEVTYESTVLTVGRDSIALWEIEAPRKKGTIAMFHGYLANRTSLLEQAERFRRLGYRTVLVDFRGSGGSSGSSTSIGFHEMHEVKAVYEYLKKKYDGPLILFGSSMGAAAILHSSSKLKIHPDGIILECPFATLYDATANRFQAMQLPAFPMADLLVFWGGIQNGYWGFDHNPADYARSVSVPVLLFYGEKDERVTLEETQAIYQNLPGEKELVTFPNAGHGNYLKEYENEWLRAVHSFLSDLPVPMMAENPHFPPRSNSSS